MMSLRSEGTEIRKPVTIMFLWYAVPCVKGYKNQKTNHHHDPVVCCLLGQRVQKSENQSPSCPSGMLSLESEGTEIRKPFTIISQWYAVP